ncbi:uncharacterized protein EV422DRAFT_389715 [Fimicolochytrium jonesii]|uniref:uncharacterized protein n=1 Tax=Fimicolochytrium jonesii TaxID=1396493 RepID=UPI0022FF38A6|nr:uncharacterized protein EV422DRAFT_389715 [Fimicolochytrium jonesii]KAI8823049.1 hypothetical protein EV422DRAFT_389715 [Fimicolochytrium jonesii]
MFPSRSSLFGKTSAPSHATGDAKTPVQSHVAGEQSLGAKQSSASGESSTKVPDKPFQLNLQHHRSLERTAGTEKQRAENPYRRASEGSPFTGELPVYVYAALASFEESAEGVEDASEHSSRTVDAGEDEDAKIIERRRLFRKTSTEHTIIKDLEENFARGSSSGALAVTAATSKPPSRLSRSSRGDESADSIGSQRATTIPHDASSLSANGVPDPSAHRSSITQLQEKLAESGAGLDDLTTLQDRLRRLKDRLGDHSAFGSMGGMAPPGVFSHANSQRHGSLVPAEPLLSILKNPTRNGSKSVQGVAPVPVTVAISEPQYKIQATHARSEDLLSRGSEVAKKRGVKNGTPPSAAHSYDFLERGASLPASTHPYSIPVIPQTPPRVEGTLPVFVYLEDDTCNMFTVTPNTTINEVRMSALSQLGVSDAIESFSVFFMVKGVNGELKGVTLCTSLH